RRGHRPAHRPADRARHHPAGRRRGGRARLGRTHGMARPPRRPGRPGPAPCPYRRTPRMSAARSKILPVGHHQPARVLTNDDLAQMVDTNDEWIRDRVGIVTRRIADSETVADMAAAAAGKALAASGRSAAEIDLIAVATCTSVDRCPNVATRVAAKLGIAPPAAYDINTAGSRHQYPLATADHAIRAGAATNALVIGAEKLSDFTDWTDRSTCVLFGDAAGAAVVTAVADGEEPGIGPVLWGYAPDKSDVITTEGWRP